MLETSRFIGGLGARYGGSPAGSFACVTPIGIIEQFVQAIQVSAEHGFIAGDGPALAVG